VTLPLVEARDLAKDYRMGEETVHALRGVSCTVERGEFVAIMGASGSGKSTFMNMVGCLDVPSGGALLVDGNATASMDSDQLAELRNRTIGFVFQQFNLLARTSALDNVAVPLIYAGVGPAERRERARAKLDAMGLGDRLDHSPATSDEIMRIFQQRNEEGITIVLVTHEADIARYARRRILFRDGRIIEDAAVTDRAAAQ
jgi:putative ABC transport system ATP-binding protein